MNITLTPETEKRISENVEHGRFSSADAMVEHALQFFLQYDDDAMDDAEWSEVEAAVEEGLAQVERGETISLEEFDRTMRAKYGIPR